MSGQFDNKIVLITGAASGIGRAAALAFSRESASVVVSDLESDGAAETVRMITETGGKAIFLRADVTKPEEVQTMLAKLDRVYGKLDFALNNAGIDGVRARTADYPEQVWMRVIEVNLTGVFLGMKYEIPLMLKQHGGVIINMASVAGVTGFVAHSAYTASKHGVIGLTKTAALEYAKAGIRVNAICPCYTRTAMVERMVNLQPGLEARLQGRIPLRRLGTAEEVAAAAVYLCSDQATFITGHSLLMDGGIMAE